LRGPLLGKPIIFAFRRNCFLAIRARDETTAMVELSAEQRRALQLLARSPNGCTEALMMAHGFPMDMLGKLVLDGLAVAMDHSTMAGRRRIKVTWLRITEAGRKEIAA
jgi:hypothetical protein